MVEKGKKRKKARKEKSKKSKRETDMRCKLIKLTLTLFFSLFSMAFSVENASANELTSAFGALVNTTSSNTYQTQGRNFMMGGSGYIKFPIEQINLVNVSAPNFSVGCNGISYTFGGLSYISGSQFTAMLKQFATSALGYVFHVALQTLCPVCDSIVKDLQKAAQLASQFANNSCEMSAKLVNKAIESSDALSSVLTKDGAIAKSVAGGENDFLKSINDSDYVQKPASWMQEIHNFINDPALSDDQKKQRRNNSPVGNLTWKSLSGLSRYNKVLLQSVLGTTFNSVSGNKNPTPQYYQPTLSAKQFASLFMFGVQGGKVNTVSTNIMECSSDTDDLDGCKPFPQSIASSKWYKDAQKDSVYSGVKMVDYGFFAVVYSALMQAVYNTSINKTWDNSQWVSLPSSIYGSNTKVKAAFTQSQINAIVSLSPMPIYQAINMASIASDVSTGLVEAASTYVAQSLAVAYIEHKIIGQIAKAGTQGTKVEGTLKLTAQKIQKQVFDLQTKLNKDLSDALERIQQNSVWVAQLHQVQSTLYRSAVANQLANNFAYSSALTATGDNTGELNNGL